MMDDRKRILDMLAEGKLTAEEAGLLLDQLDGPKAPATPPVYHPDALAAAGSEPRMARLRVYVMDAGNPKPTNVSVNLPLKAARIVGRMAQTMMPEEARSALREQGIDLDEMDLVELINAMAETGGDIINVTHEDEESIVTVRIYVE